MTIRVSDPRAGYLAHRAEIDCAIARVLEEGQYVLGPEVTAFEAEFARFLRANDVISTGNGTDAIELILRGTGIGPGDIVVTVSNTAVATVAAIELAGANPLLVEVDERTLTLSPEHLDRALGTHKDRRIKAVVVVHLYGQPAELLEIVEVCRKHDVLLIEDCAQAHGASVDGRLVGTWGCAAAFSFYPTKNLGALGDGGAVATNDKALANRLRRLRTYGWKDRHVSEEPGMNSRLDSIQAAILRVKLPYLEAENARRAAIADQYTRFFGDLDLILPASLPGHRHAFHQYVVRCASRDALAEHLGHEGVETSVLYPVPIHQQPAYRGRVEMASELPITEGAAQKLLCLPIHPWLRETELEHVTSAVKGFLSR